MKILSEFNNPLLKRKEYSFELESKGNPNYEEASKKLAEKLNVDESLIAIKKIEGKFGSDVFLVSAFVYDSVELKNTTEPKPKPKKGGVN